MSGIVGGAGSKSGVIGTSRHAHFGFKAYVSGTVNIPDQDWTEASATGTWTEEWDTDGKLASGRFTPTVQGIYLCGYTVQYSHLDNSERTINHIRKNGVSATGADFGARTDQKVGFESAGGNIDYGISASTLIKLDTDDYISFWSYHTEGNTIPLDQHITQWWGCFMGTI